MKFKNALKRIVAPVLMRSHDWIEWLNDRLHILIECVPEYSEKEWYLTLGSIYPAWQERCDVRFFKNFAVRDKYLPGADVLIGTWFSGELLARSPKLKLVQLITTGTEFLDELNAGKKIMITTAAGLSARGVAEHILLLMLALDRRLDLAVRQQDRRQWKQDRILPGIRGLGGRTAGVIGMGNIGRAVASVLSSMQMTVVYYDTRLDVKCNVAERCGSLEELLTRSDFVILCVPLNDATSRMINEKELKRMKKSAYLINIGRGQVMDEKALVNVLRQGVIAGAGIDVTAAEPLHFFSPLWNCPNLIITPHVAGNIFSFRKAIMTRFVSNIREFMSGRVLEGEWNGR
ncbi:MAG TPA: D-2-hydroxyacid dehydrogenase [bacterium]